MKNNFKNISNYSGKPMNDLKSLMDGSFLVWSLKGYDVFTGEITFIFNYQSYMISELKDITLLSVLKVHNGFHNKT